MLPGQILKKTVVFIREPPDSFPADPKGLATGKSHDPFRWAMQAFCQIREKEIGLPPLSFSIMARAIPALFICGF